MKIIKTPLVGVFKIEPTLFGDNRGFFTRAFCQETFHEANIKFIPVQANHAASACKATLRGLHYQRGEFAEDKLMRCIKGAIFDVAVDLREKSASYLHWFGCELTAENKQMLLIPKGCAHGYMTLQDDSEVYYLTTSNYTPESESGLRWDDPKIAIKWPIITNLTISDKDRNWVLL